MKRYLVLQTVHFQNDRGSVSMQEPVYDCDELSEAEEWVDNQMNPSLFKIEDQYPDDVLSDVEDYYPWMRSDTQYPHSDYEEDYLDDIQDGDGDAD